MTITLSPDAQRLIEQQLRSGRFPSAEAVVLAGLQTLAEAGDDFEPGELERLIAEGEASIKAEGVVDADEVYEGLRRRSDERRRKGG